MSRDKDQTTAPHQPLLSSLVVRPSESTGGGGASDYEPGEVRRDPPPYRSDRFSDDHGYRTRAGSGSPVRRRNADYHHYRSDFDMPRGRGYGNGRYRDSSPPYGRGRGGGGGGRSGGRGFDGPRGFGGALRGDGIRNNPNVRPREGDWICPDPSCANLNFARREYCNNCNKFRYGSGGGSPRRGYPGPPPPYPPARRFPGPPIDRSPVRSMNGYRSPPRGGWARDGPREFGGTNPSHLRHEGRFLDPPMRRDRLDYPEEDYRERGRFDRPIEPEWAPRERGFFERKAYERRPISPNLAPPLPPIRGGRFERDVRERSRSPIRGGGAPPPPPPSKDYRRDMYMERGREDRRGMVRDRVADDNY